MLDLIQSGLSQSFHLSPYLVTWNCYFLPLQIFCHSLSRLKYHLHKGPVLPFTHFQPSSFAPFANPLFPWPNSHRKSIAFKLQKQSRFRCNAAVRCLNLLGNLTNQILIKAFCISTASSRSPAPSTICQDSPLLTKEALYRNFGNYLFKPMRSVQNPTYHSQLFTTTQAAAQTELHFGARKKTISHQDNSALLKTLLSTSVGEAIKPRFRPQINVIAEYKDNVRTAKNNKLHGVQSNIFHKNDQQVRNDNCYIRMNNSLTAQSHQKQVHFQSQCYFPKKQSLQKEMAINQQGSSLRSNQQSSSLFNTLTKYYTERQGAVKPHFKPFNLSFLEHDSIKYRGIEKEEEIYARQHPIQSERSVLHLQNKEPNVDQLNQTVNEEKQRKFERPDPDLTVYKIAVNEKSASFQPKQFQTFCRINGYCPQQRGNEFILKPTGMADQSLFRIVKFLRDNENQIVVFRQKKGER